MQGLLSRSAYSSNPLAETITTVTGKFHVFAANNSGPVAFASALDNLTDWSGQFTFKEATQAAWTATGCSRSISIPWYASAVPRWTYFILVPMFSFFISLHNLQPLRSKEFVVMTAISIFSRTRLTTWLLTISCYGLRSLLVSGLSSLECVGVHIRGFLGGVG